MMSYAATALSVTSFWNYHNEPTSHCLW